MSATREVIQGREYIDAARNCLELAKELFDGGADEQMKGAPARALEQVLRQLAEAEAVLWEISQ